MQSSLLVCPGCLGSWANLFFRLQELPLQQSLRFVFSFNLPELPAAIIFGLVFVQGLRYGQRLVSSLWAPVKSE